MVKEEIPRKYVKKLVNVGNGFYILVPQRMFNKIQSKSKCVLVEEYSKRMVITEIKKELKK